MDFFMGKVKKLSKLIWNELIYGGHLISLGGVGIIISSAILLNIKISWDFLLIIYLATYTFLLYNRFKESKTDFITNPRRTNYLKKYYQYIQIIIVCYILLYTLILFFYSNVLAFFFGFFLFLIGVFYTQFLKRITSKIVAFKNIIFSLLAALLPIFLAIYYFHSLNFAIFLVCIFIFLRLFVNTVFLDIKDIGSDEVENLLTLPILLNKKMLFIILYFISILAISPIILGIYLQIFPLFSLVLLFTIPYTFYYLKKIDDKKINFIFLNYILVDTEFLLWPIFIFAGKLLWKI